MNDSSNDRLNFRRFAQNGRSGRPLVLVPRPRHHGARRFVGGPTRARAVDADATSRDGDGRGSVRRAHGASRRGTRRRPRRRVRPSVAVPANPQSHCVVFAAAATRLPTRRHPTTTPPTPRLRRWRSGGTRARRVCSIARRRHHPPRGARRAPTPGSVPGGRPRAVRGRRRRPRHPRRGRDGGGPARSRPFAGSATPCSPPRGSTSTTPRFAPAAPAARHGRRAGRAAAPMRPAARRRPCRRRRAAARSIISPRAPRRASPSPRPAPPRAAASTTSPRPSTSAPRDAQLPRHGRVAAPRGARRRRGRLPRRPRDGRGVPPFVSSRRVAPRRGREAARGRRGRPRRLQPPGRDARARGEAKRGFVRAFGSVFARPKETPRRRVSLVRRRRRRRAERGGAQRSAAGRRPRRDAVAGTVLRDHARAWDAPRGRGRGALVPGIDRGHARRALTFDARRFRRGARCGPRRRRAQGRRGPARARGAPRVHARERGGREAVFDAVDRTGPGGWTSRSSG